MVDNFEREMYEEMQETNMDDGLDSEDERMLGQQEFQEAYGAPEPEERHNQHTFLANSLSFNEPEKVTFLEQSELGTPLFNMRFLLDIEDIAKYYIDDLANELEQHNKIAEYFRQKIKNVSDSGMSKNGFVQNLNVTKKMEATRQRIRSQQNLKGGKFTK